MPVYLKTLRHPVVLYFGKRQDDGEGGWTWKQSSQIKRWAAVRPCKTSALGGISRMARELGAEPIRFKGNYYEVVVRALDVRDLMEGSLLGIRWAGQRLIPLTPFQFLDERQTYACVQAMLPEGSTTIGEA